MTLKEYEMQLALGTIDFRRAANSTKSSMVLQDIITRTSNLETLLAVATNPKVNIYTLTLLATYPDAAEEVVVACAWHPRVTLKVLERWMEYPTIKCITAVRQKVRVLQLVSGVPYAKALVVELPYSEDKLAALQKLIDAAKVNKGNKDSGWVSYKTPTKVIPWVAPKTSKDYAIWTTTGNNMTIRMNASTFNFSNDVSDTTYYEYTPVNISSTEVKSSDS